MLRPKSQTRIHIHTHIHTQIRHLALELAETEVADSDTIHTHIHIQIRHLALELAETEVADSEVARAVDEEVAGLEVSVNYRRPAVVH